MSQHFPYRFNRIWSPMFWMLGVRKTDGVTVTDDELIATYGKRKVRTPLTNVAGAVADGPHRWYTAVGLRLSFVDDSITFGTNHQRGVTITFHDKVPKVLVRDGHSSLWVSVDDPDGLVAALS